jgi:hypothetical protein|nr:hypothetical protein [Neorhizobium tomejilense]
MDMETALKNKLESDWDADFSEGGSTVWSNVHKHEDGYFSMGALDIVEGDRDTEIRVYRAFPVGGSIQVSVDVDISGRDFSSSDRSSFDYDNGERGDFQEWRDAVSREVGGDVVLVWANDEAPFFSFVARTVRVGGDERVVCGQCRMTPEGIVTRLDLDKSMEPMVSKPARARGMSMA